MLVVVTGVTRTMLHLHPDVRSGVGLQTEDTDVLLLSWFWWTWWFCSWPVLLSSTEVAPPTLALPLSLAPPPPPLWRVLGVQTLRLIQVS